MGAAQPLQQVWIALRASERQILEGVSLAHVASAEMPELVVGLVADPAARVAGFHLYTFNEVARTEAWRQAALAKLGA